MHDLALERLVRGSVPRAAARAAADGSVGCERGATGMIRWDRKGACPTAAGADSMSCVFICLLCMSKTSGEDVFFRLFRIVKGGRAKGPNRGHTHKGAPSQLAWESGGVWERSVSLDA